METKNTTEGLKMETTTKRIVNRCGCGRRANKYTTECKTCHVARMKRLHEEAGAIVVTGKCPQCAASLRRNLALTGWWQCVQYGAEGFRADSSKPACSFQTFTE